MTGASAASRAIFAAARGDAEVAVAAGAPSARGARAIEQVTAGRSAKLGERVAAPFGRRLCEVTRNLASGGYRIFSALDPAGPEPAAGQFYMLAAESGWGGGAGRPYLARAFSVAEAERQSRRGAARLPGPGRRPGYRPARRARARRAALDQRSARPALLARRATVAGRRRRRDPGRRRDRRRAAGDLAAAPAARRDPGPRPARLPRRGRTPAASTCSTAARSASRARMGTPAIAATSPTCSRCCWRATTPSSAAVYACGPPAMLEAVRTMCAERGVACELALEAPMACGFGACFGCAIPLAGGGYMRLCVDGPVVRRGRDRDRSRPGARSHLMNGVRSRDDRPLRHRLRHPVINGSGTFDAIAARRAFGERCSRSSRSRPSSRRRSRRSREPATRRRGSGRPRPG